MELFLNAPVNRYKSFTLGSKYFLRNKANYDRLVFKNSQRDAKKYTEFQLVFISLNYSFRLLQKLKLSDLFKSDIFRLT
jgi:hypothetical protein